MNADQPHHRVTGSTFQAIGITTGQIMAAFLSLAILTVSGIVIISLFGGASSTTATNWLVVVMTPVLGALLVALLVKINAMHMQFNARMDELLISTAKTAHAEGVAQERIEERARQDDQPRPAEAMSEGASP